MKNLSDYPKDFGDGYEVANWINGARPGDELWNSTREATRAYDLMRAAGWKFYEYSATYGTEVWRKPRTSWHHLAGCQAIECNDSGFCNCNQYPVEE